jgi:hypothetical protein
MKRIFILLTAANLYGATFAQKINFYSENLEQAVKVQIGLNATASVTQQIADTVTILNMSAYEIEDLRDLTYFPNLRTLDISYNKVEDLSPIINLKHLEYLNVSGNRLKSVDVLAFSESAEMLVNVSGNYIQDYKLILHNPRCIFTIIGLNVQKSLYYVNRFYTDFDLGTSQKKIYYNLWTYSQYDSIYVAFDNKRELARANGLDQHLIRNVSGNLASLEFGGQAIDSAYFAPLTAIKTTTTTGSATLSLPANYAILSAEASKSEVSFKNHSVSFKLPSKNTQDTIKIGFGKVVSEGSNVFKGYTYCFVNSGSTGVQAIHKQNMTIAPNPVVDRLTVRFALEPADQVYYRMVSLTGQLVYQEVTNERIHTIDMRSLSAGIYLLHVQTGDELYTAKVIKR